MEDELVERDEKGGYKVNTPTTMYKHLAMGMRGEGEEEEGTWSFTFIQAYIVF